MRWLAAAWLLLAMPFNAAGAADWETKWYDPHPAVGDVVLPLPCGGAMAFRPIDVPTAGGPLDDDAVTMGDPDTAMGYSEYQRGAFLAAPFAGANGSRRYFMAKYDVTRDQFVAMRGQTCPTPSNNGRQPQANVSWFDAVGAAADWSTWLLVHAKDKLPRSGEAYAFARLPTEDEWEYAARGGNAVTPEEFLARTFPMPGGISSYAWSGAMASGSAAPVGSMKPNPLGLYDMLGNVSQMTLGPYRLNRVGRLQGLVGGLVVRGGNYSTPPPSLHTAMRIEIPPYDPNTNAPTRLATMGFRLVLGATAGGGDLNAVKAEFDQLSTERNSVGDDPRKLIAELRKMTPDEALQHGLDKLDATLASGARERGDEARRALLAQLEAALALAQMVLEREHWVVVEQAIADLQPDMRVEMLNNVPVQQAEAQASLDGYLLLLRQIAKGPAHDDVETQAAMLRQELLGRNQQRLLRFLPLTVRHIKQLTGSRSLDPATVHREIEALGS